MEYTTIDNISGLNRADFQKTIDNRQTDLFILKNDKGHEVAITNYGGTLLSVMVPDKNGKITNVIQSHDTIENVINSEEGYLSTLIGRYGNRIAGAKFTLDGIEYPLAVNNGPNSLHGGPTGFHTRIWDAHQKNNQTLELSYLSKDGEEGFPGNLQMCVTFTFTNDDELILDYKGTTDKKTIVNMTHHAFFSLSGIATPTATVDNNIVTINADYYTPIDDVAIPYGEIQSVKETPLDFTTPHTIGERINDNHPQIINGSGYDHCYVLNKLEPGILTFAAKCVEPISGRSLEVYTTEPGVQLYTSNWHKGITGAHGAIFPKRSAICFEAQHFPDSPNKGHFPTVILNPGETYTQRTIYKFGVEK